MLNIIIIGICVFVVFVALIQLYFIKIAGDEYLIDLERKSDLDYIEALKELDEEFPRLNEILKER